MTPRLSAGEIIELFFSFMDPTTGQPVDGKDGTA
jgi:hypothetical protein